MMRRKLLELSLTMTIAAVASHASAGPMIELIENGEFETFSSESGWKRSGWIKADSVPGWEGASEGHIEIWQEGVMSSPALGSDDQRTGYHAETTGDSQNSVISTTFLTPGWLSPGAGGWFSFDTWNRRGSGVNVVLRPLLPLAIEPLSRSSNCYYTEGREQPICKGSQESDDPLELLPEPPVALDFSVEPENPDGQWVRHERWLDLMPSTQYTLGFRGIGGGSSGAHIDQVSLQVASADVPTPASSALLALGFAALGLRRRAREQRRGT